MAQSSVTKTIYRDNVIAIQKSHFWQLLVIRYTRKWRALHSWLSW